MENIAVSIPYLVLSTEWKLPGDVEEHILTPFGAIDLCFPDLSAGDDSHNAPGPVEIKVSGDIEPWALGECMPAEFPWALRELVLEILRGRFGRNWPPPGTCVNFTGIRTEGNSSRGDSADNAAG